MVTLYWETVGNPARSSFHAFAEPEGLKEAVRLGRHAGLRSLCGKPRDDDANTRGEAEPLEAARCKKCRRMAEHRGLAKPPAVAEPLPWEPHEHQRAEAPDQEGDILCTVCGLVLEGPSADDAREFLGLLNEAIGATPRGEDAPKDAKPPGGAAGRGLMRVGLLAVLFLVSATPGAAADVDVPAPLECRVDVVLHTLRWVSGHEVPGDRCHPPFASPWPFCPYDGCPFRPFTVTTNLPGG